MTTAPTIESLFAVVRGALKIHRTADSISVLRSLNLTSRIERLW